MAKWYTNFGHNSVKFEKYSKWRWTCIYILDQEAKPKLFLKLPIRSSVRPKNFYILKLENG